MMLACSTCCMVLTARVNEHLDPKKAYGNKKASGTQVLGGFYSSG